MYIMVYKHKLLLQSTTVDPPHRGSLIASFVLYIGYTSFHFFYTNEIFFFLRFFILCKAKAIFGVLFNAFLYMYVHTYISMYFLCCCGILMQSILVSSRFFPFSPMYSRNFDFMAKEKIYMYTYIRTSHRLSLRFAILLDFSTRYTNLLLLLPIFSVIRLRFLIFFPYPTLSLNYVRSYSYNFVSVCMYV